MMSQSNLSQAKPAYVITLERYYGGPSQDRPVTAVFFQILSPGTDLETFARQSYQHWLGPLEPREMEAWFAEWCEVWRRRFPSKKSIVEVLRQVDVQDQGDLLLDNIKEHKVAQAAVINAFDHPSVIDLRVYYLGDADVWSGVLIAGMRENHEATVLLRLSD